MGRVLQKKKNKSSLPKVRSRKSKSSRRSLIINDPLIAANWSSTQTLSQNYQRLGLTSKLNARAGGTEPVAPSAHTSTSTSTSTHDALSLAAHARASNVLIPGTVRIERDPRTGAIRSVLRPSPPQEDPNPLNDPLNAFDDFEVEEGDMAGGRGVVGQLEAEVARLGTGPKVVRRQSKFEAEWVERLVERWGDDVGRMARDRRLNPWQQSEGDLRRRIRRWREGGGGKGVTGPS